DILGSRSRISTWGPSLRRGSQLNRHSLSSQSFTLHIGDTNIDSLSISYYLGLTMGMTVHHTIVGPSKLLSFASLRNVDLFKLDNRGGGLSHG
ncbi:hypothetical protein HAX54_022216, partial [Datura stramonium]|nr:hypothetical protein [Datura stramonium]